MQFSGGQLAAGPGYEDRGAVGPAAEAAVASVLVPPGAARGALAGIESHRGQIDPDDVVGVAERALEMRRLTLPAVPHRLPRYLFETPVLRQPASPHTGRWGSGASG